MVAWAYLQYSNQSISFLFFLHLLFFSFVLQLHPSATTSYSFSSLLFYFIFVHSFFLCLLFWFFILLLSLIIYLCSFLFDLSLILFFLYFSLRLCFFQSFHSLLLISPYPPLFASFPPFSRFFTSFCFILSHFSYSSSSSFIFFKHLSPSSWIFPLPLLPPSSPPLSSPSSSNPPPPLQPVLLLFLVVAVVVIIIVVVVVLLLLLLLFPLHFPFLFSSTFSEEPVI